MCAQEHREAMRSMANEGRVTRRMEAGDVIVLDQRRKKAQLTSTRAAKAWKELPAAIRNTHDKKIDGDENDKKNCVDFVFDEWSIF